MELKKKVICAVFNAKLKKLNLNILIFHENVKRKFANRCKFANNDINKFTFLLRKRVYQYEVDDSEKINGTLLLKKKDFAVI